MQLGAMEMQCFAKRAAEGSVMLFQKDIADRMTTMTYAPDVARAISLLCGMDKAKGEAYNITGDETVTWANVLDMYLDAFEKYFGPRPRVYYEEDSAGVVECFNNKYQVMYDRMYDRQFDNGKIKAVLGDEARFTPLREGIENCVKQLREKKVPFQVNPVWEAHCDRVTGDKAGEEIKKQRGSFAKYCLFRYFPKLGYGLRRLIR